MNNQGGSTQRNKDEAKTLFRPDPDVAELLRKAQWKTRKTKREIINECLRRGLKAFRRIRIEDVSI